MALKAALMTSSSSASTHQYSHNDRYTPSPEGTSRGSPGPPVRAISTSPDLKENPIIRRRKVVIDRKASPRQRYSDVPASYQDHQLSPLLSQQRQEGSCKVCHLLSLQRRPSHHVSCEHDFLSLCDYDPCCIAGWCTFKSLLVVYIGVQCCTVGVLYNGYVVQWVCCTMGMLYSGCAVQRVCCTVVVLYNGYVVQWVCMPTYSAAVPRSRLHTLLLCGS